MAEWAMKRFWKAADVVEVDGGFTVHLDGRGVKTPAKASLILPSRAFADLVAAEWAAQDEAIDPTTMPYTRLANSAIDNVTVNFDAVVGMLADYAASDLLCYRAETPPDLVARQVSAWDPLLAWAAERFDAPLNTGGGVMFIAQPESSVQNLTKQLFSLTPFELAAAYDLVTIPGSVVIALAAISGQYDIQDLWAAIRIDEDWQAEHWGVDEEAAEVAARKRQAFELAYTAFHAISLKE